MSTTFKDCWAAYAKRRGILDDPLAIMPPLSVAQARRDALEFFSQGAVHLRAHEEAFAELFRADGPAYPDPRKPGQ